MKFFLDAANLDEIRRGGSSGVLDGVAMNPTLAAKEKKPFRELSLEICDFLKDHPLRDRGLEPFTSGGKKARATLGEIAEPAGTHKGAR